MVKTTESEKREGLKGNYDCQRDILMEKVQLKNAFARKRMGGRGKRR